MTEPHQNAATPSRFEQIWDGPMLVRLRAYVLPSVAFAVPVYFAQKFLQHLGGSALWYPRDWREVVTVLGTAVGLAIFNWARLRGRHAKATAVGNPTSRREGAKKSKDANVPQSHGDESAAQLRTLVWYGAALIFIVGYTFLRHHCVHPWQPRDAWLDVAGVRYGGAEGLPSFIELAPYAQRAPGAASNEGVHAASTVSEEAQPRHAPSATLPVVWRGTFLTPIWLSDATRAEVERRERERGIDGIQYCLQQDEDWLIDALTDREPNAMSVTTLVFLFLHIGVLGCAAAGLGSSFTLSEELAAKLAEFG